MGIVNFSIRNYTHQIACNDGEEESLKKIANSLSERINKLSAIHAKANDNLLLVLTALTLEEELQELKRKKLQLPLSFKKEDQESAIDLAVADALDAISEYVENLAKKLTK